MRIVQVITKSDPIGGAQMVLYNLVSNLILKHEIFVVIGEKGLLSEKLESINIKCIILESLKREFSIKNDLLFLKELKTVLSEIKPDIVVSHSSKAGILTRLACYRLKIPNAFTVHGWSFTPGIPIIKRIIYFFIERICGFFTDKLITVSKFDENLALRFNITSENNIKTIYNGCPDLKIEAKAENEKTIFTMIGRFQFQKDYKTLFLAIKQLDNTVKNKIHINLIGNGPLEPYYKQLAIDYNIDNLITFHGQLSDVSIILNKSDVFLLISNYEGLPLSICEAMSCSLPIIASNVGGINEMVINNYNGFLIPRKDYKYLASRIEEILRNGNIKAMAQNSRLLYDEKFSISKMVDETEKYYKIIQNGKKYM